MTRATFNILLLYLHVQGREEIGELTQQDFQKAASVVSSTFGVQKLYSKLEKAVSEFLSGTDVFVNLFTGTKSPKNDVFKNRPEVGDIKILKIALVDLFTTMKFHAI